MNQTDMFKFLYQNNLNNIYQTAVRYTINHGIEYTLGMLGAPINGGNKNAYDIIQNNYKLTNNLTMDFTATQSYMFMYDEDILQAYQSYLSEPDMLTDYIHDYHVAQNKNDYFFLDLSFAQYYETNYDKYYPTFLEQWWMGISLTETEDLYWSEGYSQSQLITNQQFVEYVYYPTWGNKTDYRDNQKTVCLESMNFLRLIDAPWTNDSPTTNATEIFTNYCDQINVDDIVIGYPNHFFIFGNCKTNTISIAMYDEHAEIFKQGIMNYNIPINLRNAYIKIYYVRNPAVTMTEDGKFQLTLDYNFNYRNLEYYESPIQNWLKSINI